MIRLFAAALLAGLTSTAHAQDAQQRIAWNRPFEPFRIVGDAHYVGTSGLSAFLVTGPQGHVLIDGGLPESAPLIAANIRRLGFRLRDVKYILINHAHYDHSGGLSELKRLTGAKLVASAGDRPDLEAGRTRNRPELDGFPSVKVDRVVRDGDVVRVGPIALTAHLTPGHTRGATSWTTVSGGRRVIFATSLTVAGQTLTGDPLYPGAADDFRRTFATLKRMKADVFLNFHPEFFDRDRKRAAQIAGRADAFVDPGELHRQVTTAEAGFEAEVKRQRRR
ncbi:MAG: subclass B3 metallo-beta-lactamase [Pseudomonadota bacterium]